MSPKSVNLCIKHKLELPRTRVSGLWIRRIPKWKDPSIADPKLERPGSFHLINAPKFCVNLKKKSLVCMWEISISSPLVHLGPPNSLILRIVQILAFLSTNKRGIDVSGDNLINFDKKSRMV